MESVLGRYKNLIVLVGVLFAQVLGLAVQVKRTTDTESTRLIRIWAVSAVTPFEKVFTWFHNGSGNLWHNYFYLRGVRQENRDLKAEIQQLRLEQVRLNEDAQQARRLQALFNFKEQYISRTVPAQVIGSGGSEQSRVVYIDKGESGGIRTDMAVITVNGIVGKVLKVFRSTAQVLLIDDQSSGVGAILEKSRLQGIVRGTPAGEVVLEKIMSDETVQPGDEVRTSGGDRIFPKGLPIGIVTRVSSGQDLFLNIHVRPSADLNKLEEVLVVTQVEEKEPTPSDSTTVRAVDILAQRLPSVPDKPAEDPNKPKAAGTGTAPTATAPTAETPKVAKAAVAKPSAPKPSDGIASVVPNPSTQDSGHSIVPVAPTVKPAGTAPKTANEQKPATTNEQKVPSTQPHATDSTTSAKPKPPKAAAPPPQTTNAPQPAPPQDQPQ
jgi:rod shape-determining protein MreC